jgi:1,4-dihydroxy-2-naphthoate octaprenyltransferase
MKLKIWLKALRIPFFTGTVFPVAYGMVFAYYRDGMFHLGRFLLAVAGTALINAGLNLANDYFDHRSGNDDFTPLTPVSGGSKVIQEGLLSPRSMLAGSLICLALAAGIGLYLNFVLPGNAILLVGVVGMVLAFFYSAPPLKIGYRGGIGELACAIGCGPVLVVGGYYVQTGVLSWAAVLASVPMGLLVGLILLINEFPDREADERARKRTLVVLLGKRRAAWIVLGSLLAMYAVGLVLVVVRVFPPYALAALLTAPIAYFIARKAILDHGDLKRMLPANFAMIGLHIVWSVVVTAALLV